MKGPQLEGMKRTRIPGLRGQRANEAAAVSGFALTPRCALQSPLCLWPMPTLLDCLKLVCSQHLLPLPPMYGLFLG